MKAKITKVEKELLPQFDPASGQDVPTLMVSLDVEFYTDDGELYHAQRYAFTPDNVPTDGMQSQADAMQADIDHGKLQAVTDEANKLADQKVAELQSLITPSNEPTA